ncbi:DENN domain-containing protein 10-like [Liolophura sinensis]|uniref:DENN domain-containing protein 10-like n=1 Tax=Liolophura sinensis TaxID=3198878 RepID=UPI0031598A72
MAALSDILSAGLIEKDTNGDVLWTWCYPSVTHELRELYIRKCGLSSDKQELLPFVYSQWRRTWYYIYNCHVEENDNLPKVTDFSLVLTAKDFNPEKYEALCKIFTKQYRKTGNPANMLESYLSVITKGTCNGEENGTFTLANFDHRQAYANGPMRNVIETFGVETILIYTALLLRKKLVVYHPHLEDLLMFIRILPAFVWHRQDWSILFPYLSLDGKDLDNLKSNTAYVAGFTDVSVESRTDLYDVYIGLADRQIEISPAAKESFAMGKLHKDMAIAMVQSVEDDQKSNQQIIKDISVKTKELLNNLKTLATEHEDGQSYITLERLKDRKMPAATENFLYTLAVCEGLVKL